MSTNKQGQALGRKGYATRERLLKAAERLLKTCSPLDLTAVAIAKEAQSSSATFYMYFDDVKDALFTLSQQAGNEVLDAMEAMSEVPKDLSIEAAVAKLVYAFNDVWNRHRHTLLYRNLEADRGDQNFEELRLEEYVRELQVIAGWIAQLAPDGNKPSKGDSLALATVLHAGLERLASVDPQVVETGIGRERMVAAEIRVLSQVMADTAKWGLLPLASKQ